MATLEGEQSRYVLDDYVDADYVLGGQWYGVLSRYVVADYVAEDYVEGRELAAAATVTAIGGFPIEATVAISGAFQAECQATATLGTDVYCNAETSLSATANLFVRGEAAPTSEFTLTCDANFVLAGEATLALDSAVSAVGNKILSAEAAATAEFATDFLAGLLLEGIAATVPQGLYVDEDYVAGNYFRDQLYSEATISADVVIAVPDAWYVDEPYPPYEWAGVTNWATWPCGVWGPDGITLCAKHTMSVSASVDHSAVDQTLTAAAEVTARGNHVFGSTLPEDLAANFQVAALGNHIFAGNSDLAAEFAAEIQGNYIFSLKETISLDMQAGVSALAGLELGGITTTPAQFDLAVDQSGTNGTAGILFQGQSDLAAAADLEVDQSGTNGTAGIFFRGQATLNAFNAVVVVGVFIYRDPYRAIFVEPESRVLVVPARPQAIISNITRIIDVYQDTRVIYVGEEDRVLEEGIAPYDTNRRRKI